MQKRRRLLAILFVIVLGLPAVTLAETPAFSANAIPIDLEPGYAVLEGTWLTDAQTDAAVVLGSETDNTIKAAVASRLNNGTYQIRAQSKTIIPYDVYFADDVRLLDHITVNGQHCVWKAEKRRYTIQIHAQQDTDGVWEMSASALHHFDHSIDVITEPGYALVRGAWISGTEDDALALLGSEADNVMKLAVLSKVSDGQYQAAAMSDTIITYDEFNAGSAWLLDKWDEGCPFFSYCTGYDVPDAKDMTLYVEQDTHGDWNVTSGYIHYLARDLQYKFSATGNPGEIAVMLIISPQIVWPVQATLSLDHFDIAAVEAAGSEAARYLDHFLSTHRHGEQDELYTILWEDDPGAI